jgi:hypothetical protein
MYLYIFSPYFFIAYCLISYAEGQFSLFYHREKRNVYRLLVGKPKGKKPLGRPRRRWIANIKMDLLETGLSVVDWIGLAQDRYRWRALVNAVMNFWVA